MSDKYSFKDDGETEKAMSDAMRERLDRIIELSTAISECRDAMRNMPTDAAVDMGYVDGEADMLSELETLAQQAALEHAEPEPHKATQSDGQRFESWWNGRPELHTWEPRAIGWSGYQQGLRDGVEHAERGGYKLKELAYCVL